ncbi:MAG: family 10 glycosylhydrolase [Thermoguttaceae bacterium]
MMLGHGGPKTSRTCRLPIARTAVAATLFVCALLASLSSLQADDLRVRVAWGGGAERIWQGEISISDGALSEPIPLGVEADQPGAMWLDTDSHHRQKLKIQHRSPRSYDGVDLLIAAPPTAKLIVRLSASDDPSASAVVETPLADLSSEPVNKELDRRGNRVLLMRTPGDSLRVHFSRDHLVFGPGEILHGTLEPHVLPLADGGRARIKVQLLGGGKELWSGQYDAASGREQKIPLEIHLPENEGVYDVVVTAVNNPNWSQAVRQPLNWKRTLAERRVQLLVLEPRTPTPPRADRDAGALVEIDPANPRWFEKLNKLPQLQLAKGRLPRLWKGPLGNGRMQIERRPLGELAQLRPNAESPDASWEAYWLPIAHPGRPYLLEVDYPSDASQTLNISVVEPNAAGALTPIGLDSGVDSETSPAASTGEPRWQQHRLIFWPRTSAPLVLVSNGRDHAPAQYGRIRVLPAGDRLARAASDETPKDRRLLAAYLDRPLIPENFLADEAVDPWSGRCLDDWWTFYEGGSRLVEYLRYAGCNGLMLGVVADGSSIYPSERVSPTPRYDTGAFFASAQDPVRKDVLEMLFRQFDRDGLRLIPMVEFAAPLPELEALRRSGGSESEGLGWIGAEGTDWCEASPPQRGLAPYYNLLHLRVQQAMLGVLRELAERYGRHPSFAGLSVRLSTDSYAQLLGPEWGMDDATIARFERETDTRVPGQGSQRFAQRAVFLTEGPQRRAWLEWRAAQVAAFYHKVHEELAAIRPDARLYLAGAGMFDGPEAEASLRPTLPRRTTVAAAMLQVGVDARFFASPSDRSGIVLLRPERIASESNLGVRAVDLEVRQMTDFDRLFQPARLTGSLFFHASHELRLESFDAKNPFKPAALWMIAQPSPSGPRNRQRFVHSLAMLDAQAMFDGGWRLPMGQEESIRDVAAAYRALPAIRFEPIGEAGPDDAAKPVMFRRGEFGGRTYFYVVNDAPFAATGRIHIEAGSTCQLEELTGRREIARMQPDGEKGFSWEVALEPYDLVAVRFSEPGVQFSRPRTTWSDTVEASLGAEIRRLGARAAALRNPPPLDAPVNAGFERSATRDGPVPDWAVTTRSGVTVELDTQQGHGGRQSAHLASTGAVACLVSRPIAAPNTGRLSMSVWLRVPNADQQPPLRLALDAKLHGRDYYRFATVGQSVGTGQPDVPIASQWSRYVFQVDDLPLEGLTSLRVRFDLMGRGEVWVDDVQIYSLAFSKPELLELSKLITLANVNLQNGQIAGCLRLLDGYWPRFLNENVPLSPGAETALAKPAAEEEKPPERSGWIDRMKDMVPESLRF